MSGPKPMVRRTDAGVGVFGGASAVPSEFTPETTTIFSSLLDPVFRPCLAQLRASSRGVYLAEQSVAPGVPVLTRPGASGRLGPPPAPSQDGAALDGWTWTG